MALEKECPVPEDIPIWREIMMKHDRPARGTFSFTGNRAAASVAREPDRTPVTDGGDGELLAGIRAGSPSAPEPE